MCQKLKLNKILHNTRNYPCHAQGWSVVIKISRLRFVFPTNIWMNFIFPQTLRWHFVTTFFSHLLAAMFDKCSCLCMWINHFFSQTWGRIHFFYHSHQGDFFSHKYVDDFFILLKEINNIRRGVDTAALLDNSFPHQHSHID
jgi:hypothetical protein